MDFSLTQAMSRLAVAVFAVISFAQSALAADDVALKAENQTTSALANTSLVNVSANADLTDARQFRVKLSLSAALANQTEKRKIVSSSLVVQTKAGSAEAATVAAFDGNAPVEKLAFDKEIALPLDAKGPVARAAMDACRSRPLQKPGVQSPVSLDVAVVWRVTTGKFQFRWTDYDLVAPSNELELDRNFYGERRTVEREIPAKVLVVCGKLPTQAVANASKQTAKLPEKPVLAMAPKPAGPAGKLSGAAPKADLETKVASAADSKPVCNGGMVRQLDASPGAHVCICPGNTVRTENGIADFTCVRKLSRR